MALIIFCITETLSARKIPGKPKRRQKKFISRKKKIIKNASAENKDNSYHDLECNNK